jgi:hypothetical protein
MSNRGLNPQRAVPLDRETLIAGFDGIRQLAQGGRRAPHKPLLLLYALARLKHDAPAGFTPDVPATLRGSQN